MYNQTSVSVRTLSERDGTDEMYHKDEIVEMVSAMFGAWHEGRIKHNVSTETAAMRAIAQGLAEREVAALSAEVDGLKEYSAHCIRNMAEAATILAIGGWGAKKKALAILQGRK